MSAPEGSVPTVGPTVGQWTAGAPGVLSGSWFAVCRALLGLYLFVHAAELLPYAAELFSREGVLPDPAQNLLPPVFPSVLSVWDSPAAARTLVASMAALSIALALGWRRRLVSLALWYGWACLFNRNNLIANPSLPYVGLLLLVLAAAPPGEPRDPARSSRWRLPRDLERVVAFLLFAGYTYSGWTKLPSPSWVDGSALFHVLALPLARDLWLRELLLDHPALLRLATWGALALELAALPLALGRLTRAWAWLLTTALQLGLLVLMDFTDLTVGMLLVHAFVAPWALARAPGRTRVRRTTRRSRQLATIALLGLAASCGGCGVWPRTRTDWRGPDWQECAWVGRVDREGSVSELARLADFDRIAAIAWDERDEHLLVIGERRGYDEGDFLIELDRRGTERRRVLLDQLHGPRSIAITEREIWVGGESAEGYDLAVTSVPRRGPWPEAVRAAPIREQEPPVTRGGWIAPGSDGGLYVAGENGGDGEFVVYRITRAGRVAWRRTWSPGGISSISAMVARPGGGCWIAGSRGPFLGPMTAFVAASDRSPSRQGHAAICTVKTCWCTHRQELDRAADAPSPARPVPLRSCAFSPLR